MLREYGTLVWADLELALRGVHAVVTGLESVAERSVSTEEIVEMRHLADRVKGAALTYRPGARCLPQAVAAARLLRAKSYPVALVIAVRRFPFAAHAWVECRGEVLTDRQSVMREFLPILKNEPAPSSLKVRA